MSFLFRIVIFTVLIKEHKCGNRKTAYSDKLLSNLMSSCIRRINMKVGINGFGRIGRFVFRAAMNRPDVEIVGIVTGVFRVL